MAGAGALDTVLVLHTNDLHGHISGGVDRYGGAARIGAYFRQVRAARSDVLVLDAGDCVAGTPVSTLFCGTPIFRVMSAMGYDAAVLGNHEFDYGWEHIRAFREAASFPLLAANAYSPQGELIADEPYVLVDVDGVRVGVIGVLTERTPAMTTVTGNRGLVVQPAMPVLAQLVGQIRARCDLVIVLSHLGSTADREAASTIEGIDLIVGGHDHKLFAEPLVVDGTAIVQAGCFGAFVGQVEVLVDVDGGRVESIEGRVMALRDLPEPDSEVEGLVDRWEAEVSKLVDVPIGVGVQALDIPQAARFVEGVLKEHAGADFGYYNPGGVRAGLPEGRILARHVWNIHPFGNTLATITLKGCDIGGGLLEALKNEGVQLDPDRVYAVATNSFVCERPALFLGKPARIEVSEELIRDIVIDHIRHSGRR